MRGNQLIREARRRAGLTQAELAAKVRTTQSAIARIERGVGSPTLERISEIAEACGLEVRVGLVPIETDDWVQVRANASMSPDERIAKALGALKLAESLRSAGSAARTVAR